MEYINNYLKYLEYEKKYSANTISSYANALKKYDSFIYKNDIDQGIIERQNI